MEKEYKHISIYETAAKPRTKTFEISSNHDGTILGNIYWYGAWRAYVFEPMMAYPTIWSEDCLKDLHQFLIDLREEHKKRQLQAREEQKNGDNKNV